MSNTFKCFCLCCLQKTHKSKSNVVELTDLDRGVSYCFSVQAYLPSRRIDKQLGEMSQTQCSEDDNVTITNSEFLGFIQAGNVGREVIKLHWRKPDDEEGLEHRSLESMQDSSLLWHFCTESSESPGLKIDETWSPVGWLTLTSLTDQRLTKPVLEFGVFWLTVWLLAQWGRKSILRWQNIVVWLSGCETHHGEENQHIPIDKVGCCVATLRGTCLVLTSDAESA